ncbi:MAG: hypothetical protein ACI9DH_000473 [Halioglobus sp.]|jgi:hypothetical protein
MDGGKDWRTDEYAAVQFSESTPRDRDAFLTVSQMSFPDGICGEERS